MKKAERIIRGLLAFLLAAGCYFFLAPAGRFSAQIVLSGSMEPAVRTGALIFTDKKQTKPKQGDVISYRLNHALITHRVLREENGIYITQGDANETEDPNPVYPEQIEMCIRDRSGNGLPDDKKNRGVCFTGRLKEREL